MTKTDEEKVKNFIESYYKIKLSTNEQIALSRELKDYTYDDFKNNIQKPLLISIQHFTVAELHRVIENNNNSREFLRRLGKKSWNEFYANDLEENMQEELKKINILMNNFSKKYSTRIQVETIKSMILETKEESFIYNLKTAKGDD